MAGLGLHFLNVTSKGVPTQVIGEGVPFTWGRGQGGWEQHRLAEGSRWGLGLQAWCGLEQAQFLPTVLQACGIPLRVIFVLRAGGPINELQAE